MKFELNFTTKHIYSRKDLELQSMSNQLEDEQVLVGKLQRQIKEMTAKIQELEEEIEAQKQARLKVNFTAYLYDKLS